MWEMEGEGRQEEESALGDDEAEVRLASEVRERWRAEVIDLSQTSFAIEIFLAEIHVHLVLAPAPVAIACTLLEDILESPEHVRLGSRGLQR